MSNLPLEVVEMLGQTIAKVVPITIVLAVVFSVLTHFWACNPGNAVVAQARTDHRHLLLVLRAGVCAGAPDRAHGDSARARCSES